MIGQGDVLSTVTEAICTNPGSSILISCPRKHGNRDTYTVVTRQTANMKSKKILPEAKSALDGKARKMN
jgi:hypothetical protein